MTLLCRMFGHRKPFRIMSPMIWEPTMSGAHKGHNATVGCFFCGYRRRVGGIFIGHPKFMVVE